MTAWNEPLALVEIAPRSAGGTGGVAAAFPAMKWTSLYPDSSASTLSCRSVADADAIGARISASTRKREKNFMEVASRRVTPGALRRRRLANSVPVERVPVGPDPRYL